MENKNLKGILIYFCDKMRDDDEDEFIREHKQRKSILPTEAFINNNNLLNLQLFCRLSLKSPNGRLAYIFSIFFRGANFFQFLEWDLEVCIFAYFKIEDVAEAVVVEEEHQAVEDHLEEAAEEEEVALLVDVVDFLQIEEEAVVAVVVVDQTEEAVEEVVVVEEPEEVVPLEPKLSLSLTDIRVSLSLEERKICLSQRISFQENQFMERRELPLPILKITRLNIVSGILLDPSWLQVFWEELRTFTLLLERRFCIWGLPLELPFHT